MRWLLLILLFGGCSRGGFEAIGDGELIFDGVAADPFGGAEGVGLEVEGGAARLAREVGFDAGTSQLVGPLTGVAATAVGDEILFSAGSRDALDGFPTGCSDELWRLDPVTGQLTDAGRLPHDNQGHGLIVDSTGALVLVMGCCNSSSSEEERAYRRPAGSTTFQEIGTFPVYAYGITALPYDDGGADRVVVTGGRGSGPLRDAIQVLDVSTGLVDRWTETLPTPRCLSAGAIVGTTMLVMGGHTHSACTVTATSSGADPTLDEIVAIDLVGETVSVIGQLPQPLGGACAVVRDHEVLLFGGFNYSGTSGDRAVSAAVYTIDPETGVVSAYPEEMPGPRAGMACTINADDQIVLAGGIDASGVATRSVWLFEPYVAEGSLTSSPVDAGRAAVRWHIDVEADAPSGTSVDIEVRISDSEAGLENAPWSAHDADLPRGRYMQWRATLRTTSAAATPLLHSVQVAFSAL